MTRLPGAGGEGPHLDTRGHKPGGPLGSSPAGPGSRAGPAAGSLGRRVTSTRGGETGRGRGGEAARARRPPLFSPGGHPGPQAQVRAPERERVQACVCVWTRANTGRRVAAAGPLCSCGLPFCRERALYPRSHTTAVHPAQWEGLSSSPRSLPTPGRDMCTRSLSACTQWARGGGGGSSEGQQGVGDAPSTAPPHPQVLARAPVAWSSAASVWSVLQGRQPHRAALAPPAVSSAP